jgi:hypothetical protein
MYVCTYIQYEQFCVCITFDTTLDVSNILSNLLMAMLERVSLLPGVWLCHCLCYINCCGELCGCAYQYLSTERVLVEPTESSTLCSKQCVGLQRLCSQWGVHCIACDVVCILWLSFRILWSYFIKFLVSDGIQRFQIPLIYGVCYIPAYVIIHVRMYVYTVWAVLCVCITFGTPLDVSNIFSNLLMAMLERVSLLPGVWLCHCLCYINCCGELCGCAYQYLSTERVLVEPTESSTLCSKQCVGLQRLCSQWGVHCIACDVVCILW